MDKYLKSLVIVVTAISLGLLSLWIWSPADEASEEVSHKTQTSNHSTASRLSDENVANAMSLKSPQERNSVEPIPNYAQSGSMEAVTSAIHGKDNLGTSLSRTQIPSNAPSLVVESVDFTQNPLSSVQNGSSPMGMRSAIAIGGFSTPSIAEIVQDVPEGAKVPALFYDKESRPIPQQKALDRIAVEFQQNVSEIPPGMTKEEVWEAARAIADERYITLFGYQAFNQYHTQAAKEALKEKRARAAASGQ
jgi:hypothetical protein